MPMRKKTDGRCQICYDVGHGYHFGVIACRACAAFFRRTIALNLHYKCRFDEHCAINKSVRCMCRKCRLSKCLRMGMKPEAVQLNRDPIGHVPHKERSTVIMHSSPSSSSTPSTSSPDCSGITPDDFDARLYEIFEQASLYKNGDPGCSILEEMLRGYHEIEMKRKFVHAHSQNIEATGPETEDQKVQRIYANCKQFGKALGDEILLSACMVTHFYPFMELPAGQRMVVFKHFWPRFLRLERAYATYLKLGADITDERTLLYNGHVTHKKAFIHILSQISKLSADELEKFLSASQETSWSFVRIPLKLLKPTEFEFIAMCGYLLWTIPGVKGVEPPTIEKARESRNRIFTALHRYYTKVLTMPAYAPRLAECMALLSAVEVSVSLWKEDTMILDLFDLLKVDMKFLNFYK